MSNDIGKGTVKLVIDSSTFDCDECEVTRKLNYGWKTASIKSRGNSLPADVGEIVEIYYERDGSSAKKIDGFVTSNSQIRNGQDTPEYHYEIYGREAFVNYRLYKPANKVTLATDFITDLVTSIGYPTPVFDTALNNVTIVLDNLYSDYVHNHLRNLNDKYTINYFYDTGLTLHAFYNCPTTIDNVIFYGTEREKVSDITNVYNRISLVTDEMYINDSYDEYLTDSATDATKWTYKRFKYMEGWSNRLFDDSVRNCELSAVADTGTRSIYALGETFTPTLLIDPNWKFAAYLQCDLGSLMDISTLVAIKYKIKITSSGTPYTCRVETQLYEMGTDKFPPNEGPIFVPYPMSNGGQLYITTGETITTGDDWNTITEGVRYLHCTGSRINKARYLGIYVNCDFNDADIPANGVTFHVYVDDLHITTTYSTIFTNTGSAGSFGVRELKPDNNGYVVAHTTAELEQKCNQILKYAPEESLRKLKFPGSLDIEVGTKATITFDDYTSAYKIEEIRDIYADGQWMQEISVSSSPIYKPKTRLADKLREWDNRIKSIRINDDTYATDIVVNLSDISARRIIVGDANISNIGEGAVINTPTINGGEFNDIDEINALVVHASEISDVETMNVGIMTASTIGTVGVIENIGLARFVSFGTVNSIEYLNTVQTAIFNQIQSIQNMDYIGSMSCNQIGSINNIDMIYQAEIGNLTNVGTINIQTCKTIGYLNYLGSVDTIQTVNWLEHIDYFGTINTINTIYRIDNLESAGEVTANILYVNDFLEVNTITTEACIIDILESVDELNASVANITSATITTAKVNGTINITSASIGAIIGTINSANFLNCNINTISSIGQMVGLNNKITVASGTTFVVTTAGTIINCYGTSMNFTNGTITNFLVGTITGSSINFSGATINNIMIGTGIGNILDFTNATIDNINITGAASINSVYIASQTVTNITVMSTLIGSNIITSTNIGTLIIDADNVDVLEIKHFPVTTSNNVRAYSSGKTVTFTEQLAGNYTIKYDVTIQPFSTGIGTVYTYLDGTIRGSETVNFNNNSNPSATMWTSSADYGYTIHASGRANLSVVGNGYVDAGSIKVCYDINQFRNYTSS